ncbi:hypothetical protein GCM10011575_40970 [Microlunatus endophyticus]|uniref:Uncharacterized protein n=1 Tax=Microlunatus endophyticus TaxID=1716077 RepID=A0A917W8F3_9ACTN|nr:hypothetical protein GCM10011575_40970 [Microlunatus endophyticus]
MLTPEAFVVSKTVAWLERNTPRDLYGLWALKEAGFLTATAADLYRSCGPTGHVPSRLEFPPPPSESDWTHSLGQRERIRSTADQDFRSVTDAWSSLAAEQTAP